MRIVFKDLHRGSRTVKMRYNFRFWVFNKMKSVVFSLSFLAIATIGISAAAASVEISSPTTQGPNAVLPTGADDAPSSADWTTEFFGCSSNLTSAEDGWRPNVGATYELRFSDTPVIPANFLFDLNRYEFLFEWNPEHRPGWIESWYFPSVDSRLGEGIFAGRGFVVDGQVRLLTSLPRAIPHPLNGAFLFFIRPMGDAGAPAHVCSFIEETPRSLNRRIPYYTVVAPLDMGTRTGNGIGLSANLDQVKAPIPEPQSGMGSGCGTIHNSRPLNIGLVILFFALCFLLKTKRRIRIRS